MILLFALLGCTGEPPAETDASRYLASLSLPPTEALERCAAIEAPDARGDCRVGVADRAAAARDEAGARAACEAFGPEEPWGWECWTRVVEGLRWSDERAEAACARTGRLRAVCRNHALEAATGALGWDDASWGEEAERFAAIEALVGRWRDDDPDTLAPASRSWDPDRHARELLVERLADRLRGIDLHRRACGVLDDEACGWFYAFAVASRAPEEPVRHACTDGPPSEPPQGLLGWYPDASGAAAAGWRRLCAIGRTGVLGRSDGTPPLFPRSP